jgi:uncharacterized membrane protein
MTATLQLVATLTLETPELGWVAGVLLAVGVVGVVVLYALAAHRNASHFGLLALRLGAIVCGLLALWHPAWVRHEQVAQRPVVAVVLDDSASMANLTGTSADKPRTRFDEATELLTRRLRPALEHSCQLELFDDEGQALDGDKLPRTAEGTTSPLTSTLLQIQQTLHDQPVAGIVLLSDGREVTEQPTSGDLEKLHTPVHVIQFVDDTGPAGPPNVAIQGVAANRRALIGNMVRVAVDLAATGVADNTPVPVSILDGEHPVATRTVQVGSTSAGQRVDLEFVPRRPGELTYTVQAGAAPGELNLADNRQTFPLRVTRKPLTVLYVDGVLRWEGKYLREALTSDPDINLISAVRTAPPGTDRGSQGLLLPPQLANIDVVILGDVEAAFFSSDEIAALRAWVLEQRGAVVLTGGYHSFGPDGFGATALRDILPVEFSGESNPQSDQPFNLKLTEAGRENPIFNLTGDPVRDAAFFQALPPLSGCSRIAAVKPGGEVLAVNPQIGAPDDSGGGLPVLVAQDVGSGRTMVFAVDTTWRWRMVVGGLSGDSSFYPQFWGQLVRWMAGHKEEGTPRLFVSTDRYRYRAGQTVEVNVELRAAANPQSQPSSSPSNDYRVTATALTEGGSRSTVPLTERTAGHFRGTFGAPAPGRLDLLVRATPATVANPSRTPAGDADSADELSATATVEIERPDLEALDPRPDPQWLARVAQLTGGRVVRPDRIEAWADSLSLQPVQTTRATSTGFAGERTLGGLFLTLLCVEWILRRRRRLV